jgi:hypothetical protein
MVDQLIDTNEREARARLSRLGVQSVWDRWHILRRHQKIEATVIAVATCGVTIGSMVQVTRGLFGALRPDEPER